jgi:MoaA/NifB/PqqE/SkfB family radical SAM enzyme
VKFANENYAKKMTPYNVTPFVSFHNPDEEVSRFITGRKNHYPLLLAGLENLMKYNIGTEATVVLTTLNQDKLDEINTALSCLTSFWGEGHFIRPPIMQ